MKPTATARERAPLLCGRRPSNGRCLFDDLIGAADTGDGFDRIDDGEAVRHLPDELKTANPDVPWATMAAVRNRLAHAYFGIDDTILFTTIAEELTDLLPRVEAFAREHDVNI